MVAKGNPYVVVLADETSVDDAVPVAGYQPAVARDTGKARHVVHCSAVWRSHDELVGWNLTPTRAACPAQAEQTVK